MKKVFFYSRICVYTVLDIVWKHDISGIINPHHQPLDPNYNPDNNLYFTILYFRGLTFLLV